MGTCGHSYGARAAAETLDGSRRYCEFNAAHRFPADSGLAACAVVFVSLRAYRTCLRQSGVLPLQRGGNSASYSFFSGAGLAHLAGYRLSPSLGSDRGHSPRHVDATAAAGFRFSASPNPPSGANGFLRGHVGVCGGHGLDWRRSTGALYAPRSSTCDHSLRLHVVAQAQVLAGGSGVYGGSLYRRLVLESTLWLLSGGQSRLSRLHR